MRRPRRILGASLIALVALAAVIPCPGVPGAGLGAQGTAHTAHPEAAAPAHELAHQLEPGCGPDAPEAEPSPDDVRAACPCGCGERAAPSGASALDPAVLATTLPREPVTPAGPRLPLDLTLPAAPRSLPDPVPLRA